MNEGPTPSQNDRSADRGRHIVRGIGSLTAQSALSAVLGLILLIALVRFLSKNDYGAYSAVSVTVGIASVVTGFGLGAAVVKFLPPAGGDKVGLQWGAAKASLYLTLVLATAGTFVLVAVAPYLSDYFLKTPSNAWVFYLGAAILFMTTVDNPFLGALQGMRKYGSFAKVLLGSRAAAVGMAVVGVALYHSLAIALAALAVYSALVLAAIVPPVWRPLTGADPGPYYGRVMSYALPLGVASIVSVIASNADIVVVGGYLNPGSLAVYYATIQVSSILSSLFVTPLVTTLFAETSFSSEREPEVKRGTSLALRFVSFTLLPASLLVAAMARQLFVLFSGGGSYTEGIPYLELILVFYAFAGIQNISISVLQGVGRTRQVLAVGAVTAIGEVVLSASLVPGLGLAGAAYSRVAMMVVGCIISIHYIMRYIPRPVDFGFYVRALLASVIPATAVYVPSVLISSRVLTLVPYTLLGLGIFIVCARGLKLVSAEDKTYLSHLLPGKLQRVLELL